MVIFWVVNAKDVQSGEFDYKITACKLLPDKLMMQLMDILKQFKEDDLVRSK